MSPAQVLIPFDRREALSLKEAVGFSPCGSTETIRRWCAMYDIGRVIGGRWYVSHPALLMHVDGDRAALKAYLAGDRTSERVKRYFDRAGLPLAPEIKKDAARSHG